MTTVFQFLHYLLTNHGYWPTIGIMVIVTFPLLLIVYIMFSKSSIGHIIDEKISEKIESDKSSHIHKNRLRKQFTIDVQEILQDLAERTNANRVILFEFSNGSSNIVGLPFLFMTASAEVATAGLNLMSQRHQRINTSIIAGFLTKLEKEGRIFIDRSSPILDEYNIIKQIMHNADIGSALFYSVQGMEEAIGFLAIICNESSGNNIDFQKAVISAGKASQRISSMINFDEITKIENKRKKWKWPWMD